MTLLDSVARAAAAADAGDLSPQSDFPIVLNPAAILPNLNPSSTSSGGSLLKPVEGWKISEADAAVADISTNFSKTLKRKLKNHKSLTRGDFLQHLNSFLNKIAEENGSQLDLGGSDIDWARSGIEKLRFLIGKEVASLIVEGCLVLELWEVLEILIVEKLVGHLYSVNLIEKLVEKSQSDLLCLCVKHIKDLRSSEIFSVLKFFLSGSNKSGVRKVWKSQALLAIEMATQTWLPKETSIVAKEASILLMMAYDGFSSSELCLHYMFGAVEIDGLVLASAVSRLDGSDVLGLVRYFVKWLEKYQKFPQARPCRLAKKFGLGICDIVPSLESIVRGLGLVLDEHFYYLVLNSELHGEMRALQEVVSSLALEAELCQPVDNVCKHLKSEVKKRGDL